MDDFTKMFKTLERKIEILERALEIRNLTIPTDGFLIVRKLASDPVTPQEGEIWYNTTSDVYKGYQNGVVKTFTTS